AALDDGGATAHEDVGDLEVGERTLLLVIRVVDVPHGLRRLRFVLRRLHRRGEQQRAEDARAAARPPLRHLVDGLTRVALAGRDLVDGEDREVAPEAGLRAIGIVEAARLALYRLARADGVSDRLSHPSGLCAQGLGRPTAR